MNNLYLRHGVAPKYAQIKHARLYQNHCIESFNINSDNFIKFIGESAHLYSKQESQYQIDPH